MQILYLLNSDFERLPKTKASQIPRVCKTTNYFCRLPRKINSIVTQQHTVHHWTAHQVFNIVFYPDETNSKLSQLSQTTSALDDRENKKAVLSQRWPRDARYISSRCGDMAIRNIEVGGGRHLGFVRTVNSAVRSAVTENPTLEPNMKWIGSPVAEIWPFAYVGGIWNPFWGKWRS